ncbi:MAG: exported protein of unknown function [Nitrospira sp.]|jgi:uncharacterized membrane protein affecting hemolysin expression|nr:exported protein of unknown function [Nitrospira sp.]
MAYASAHASRLPRTWLPAILISFVISILCATALYFFLAQHDRSLVAQGNAAALAKVESSGRAMARTFASFSESLLGEHLAHVQQAIEGRALPTDLVDAAVITEENRIVAARNPAAIGRQLQDPAWVAARRTHAESVSMSVERGRPVLIVVEPLRQQEHIIGWVRFILAMPEDVATARSKEDLARSAALAILPLFVLMATLLMLTLRGIMSRVRSLIGGIVLEALDESREPPHTTVALSKAG